ncbi:MAG: gamma-glutamyltransferase [Bacteroidetes bacterium]|nr:gamma-glutamyltransferase [Bacteroidota bacterium]
MRRYLACFLFVSILFIRYSFAQYAPTQKPPLHGKNWMAITGKPLAATAGSILFQQGGNAVDAACAMLAATCTMWDVLSWGGETQALLYHPKLKKVIAINAMGVAPSGATASYFKERGYTFPPEYGPLAATTPGTPGGLCYLLANYGTKSLKEVLAPALELAAGYPIEAQTANSIERAKERIKQWKYSRQVLLPHLGEKREAPYPGEIFKQEDLLNTLTKMIEAETLALQAGKTRKEAIMAAYDRFYKGDIADAFVRGVQEQGGLITKKDLENWRPLEEEPLKIEYKGIEVYKLSQWTQGPSFLQALRMLEEIDVKKLGYNSPQYIHTLYQVLNMTFADRDFYYGDPYKQPIEPMAGLLSKAYAKDRLASLDTLKNISNIGPGDPYPYQGEVNPYKHFIEQLRFVQDSGSFRQVTPTHDQGIALLNKTTIQNEQDYQERLWRGTTTVEAADKEGWFISITPSGGWIPAVIAGNTGVGLSQRMQSFVLDSALNPFNIVEPGKRPRVTLTPSLAIKDGEPFMAFGVQGGDTQDQNLVQFFLNVVEFGMTVQQAAEAPNFNTNQLWLSLGGTTLQDRKPRPGQLLLNRSIPAATIGALKKKGYQIKTEERTSGPINAILFDKRHRTLWGGSSNHGEDYGIAW